MIIDGINIVKRHKKATQESPGKIEEREASIHISNVAHIDPENGKATRVKYEFKDDVKRRVSVVSGSLPAGVTIGTTSNPAGSTYRAVISGTLPNTANETQYSFTVRATDAQGQTTDQALSITAEVGISNAGGFC